MKHITIETIFSAPFSCMNRGEGGEIKSTIFGGYGRIRISGQCLKRHDRIGTQLILQSQPAAIRTSDLLSELEKFWKTPHIIEADQRDSINKFLIKTSLYNADTKEEETGKAQETASPTKKESSAIAYLGFPEIEAIAGLLALPANWNLVTKRSQKELKKLITTAINQAPRDFDCAINGRMFTGLPQENIDSAVRYAHAISINAAEEEFDFFTVKDEAVKETQGAGHLNESSASSPTFYKFCTINAEQLLENLSKGGSKPSKEELAIIVCAYIKAAILTLPDGKQTTMFGKTLPHYVRVAIYNDCDVYSNAECFLEPVRARNAENRSMEAEGIYRLKEAYKTSEKFGITPNTVFEIEAGTEITLSFILSEIRKSICSEG